MQVGPTAAAKLILAVNIGTEEGACAHNEEPTQKTRTML